MYISLIINKVEKTSVYRPSFLVSASLAHFFLLECSRNSIHLGINNIICHPQIHILWINYIYSILHDHYNFFINSPLIKIFYFVSLFHRNNKHDIFPNKIILNIIFKRIALCRIMILFFRETTFSLGINAEA